MSLKIAGQNPTGKHLGKMKESPNYKKDGFSNLSNTPMMLQDASYYELLKKYFKKNPLLRPPFRLPSVKGRPGSIRSDTPVITWFGHSSYLITIHEKNILVDPVFSGNAAPVSWMVKSFAGSDVYTPDDFPQIDALILTHDHYDHLDYRTVIKLRPKVKAVYCSLGLLSHLSYWGFTTDMIHEIDWWQKVSMDQDLSLTAAPARHFSGRGLKRFKTLWSSFILRSGSYNLYLGGDSGYDQHFKEIGEKYGPFDIAILECGQYNTAWPFIHMMPEETVQAAADLRANLLLPVHWGKFALAMHPWDEPIKRLVARAGQLHMKVTTPMIGEPVVLGAAYPYKDWWKMQG
jgi:L-ascorbate metabolism protein UlaG (beta-lactamase superfamily)